MKTNKGTTPKPYSNAAECSVCGEVFNSPYGFDKHRVGKYADRSRVCKHPTEVGLDLNSRGLWAELRDEESY